MRVLIESECDADYLAKCHEAFRTGLRCMFDTRMFGKGYPNYDPSLITYQEIIKHAFPDAQPHLLLATFSPPTVAKEPFTFTGLSDVQVSKAILLADFWNVTEGYQKGFLDILDGYDIGLVLSYFPQPLEIFSETAFATRFIWVPACFDPAVFNNWHMDKQFDVGFLAAGTSEHSIYYPERFAIHQKLLQKKNIKYLWAKHPGWQRHSNDHPLVGRGFSKAINSCRLFVTTRGIYKNPHAKYIEIMASHTVLLADEPEGADRLHLQDGVNYVKISEDDVLEKIDSCLAQPSLCKKIAEAGYRTAMRYHNCYVRAFEFYEAVKPRMDGRSS